MKHKNVRFRIHIRYSHSYLLTFDDSATSSEFQSFLLRTHLKLIELFCFSEFYK